MELGDYNNFEFVSDQHLAEKLQPQLDCLRRKTSAVIFRHGHRTPFKYRSTNDPMYSYYLESSFYNDLDPSWFQGKAELMYDQVQLCSYSSSQPVEDLSLQFDLNLKNDGILTRLGAQQLKSLGCALSARYQQELADIVQNESPSSNSCSSAVQNTTYILQHKGAKLLAMSTRTERTIESLKCVLQGLFQGESIKPPVTASVFENVDENWFLVPYRAYPEMFDGIVNAHSHAYKCSSIPGYDEWVESWAARCKDIASSLPNVDLQQTRDYLTSFKTFDMMPSCPIMTESDYQLTNVLCTYAVSAESILVERGVAKSTSQFFEGLLHLLTQSDSRLCLLSAHDTTVNFIRLALKAQDFTWPDFGYSVTFELYQEPSLGDLKLMVLFNLRPVILHAICPQALIPLSDFIQYVNCNLKV